MEKKCYSLSILLSVMLFGAVGLVLFSSCASTGTGYGRGGEPEIEQQAREIYVEWQECRRSMDIDGYMALFWDDAVTVFGAPDGDADIFRGYAEVRENIEFVFERFGVYMPGHVYPPAEYRFDEINGVGELLLTLEDPYYKQALRFEERKGEVKIAEHWTFYRFFWEPELGELAAWADEAGNQNGILNEEEQIELYIATYRVLYEPHEVDTPLAEFFDWNFDGFVGELENDIARRVLLRNRFRRIDRFFPELARHRLPPHDRSDVNMHDGNWIHAAVNGPEGFFPTGLIEHEDHRLADMNADGLICPLDYEFYQDIILRAAAVNPAPILYNREMPAFIDDIYRWADQDFNGEVSDDELGQAGFELFDTVVWPGGVAAWTPIARFFDRNRDSALSESELEWALVFITDFLLPKAIEEEVVVWDWDTHSKTRFKFDTDGSPALSEEEREELRSFILDFDVEFEDQEEADTTEWRWLDSNGDNFIEMWEAGLFMDMLFAAVLRSWFLLPEEEANSLVVRTVLDATADTDGDGLLSMQEREELIAALTREHEVASTFDREIDSNSDGHISMEEIFRAKDTGYIAAGKASAQRSMAGFETRSNAAAGRLGTRSSSEQVAIKVKAVSTWGSNLAVLGVRDLTETIAPAQSGLMISFLENAFVNFGNVSVVDRQNLERIMEEYQYQNSALVSEETAVEIGKLSGADAIAIGNLSSLSDVFYLHIKVIDVKSGKIIGSSISEGNSAKEFLNMCNGAVEPLF
ncbi:MAG: hypothetical protein K9L66_06190 [Spirochaetaceae bacterium]|nr:hypothetical protein [Spirochaetaceae bacterium]MCF7938858.1 hypothetical protein [Spirochaetales bacterium]